MKVIVGIQPAYDIAGSHLESFIERVCLTGILLRDPPNVRKLFKNLNRVIRRGSINDDVLKVGIVLRRHTVDTFLDQVATVERWSNDGDLRPRGHSYPFDTRLLRY